MRTAFAGAAGLAAILAAMLPQAAFAGYRIVEKDGDTSLASGGRLKSVPHKKGEPSYVFDMNRGRMLLAAPASRTYWEGTVEEFCKEFPKAIEQAMAQWTAQMQKQQEAERAKLSPAERKKREKEEADLKKWTDEMNTPAGQAKAKREMEEWAKKMGVDPKDLEAQPEKPPANAASLPPVKVEKTGETATLAGIAARKWRVTVGGEPYEDHWLATDQAFLRELGWDRAARTFERFQRCFSEAGKEKGPSETIEETKEYQQLQLQGFPLKVVSYDNGDSEGRLKNEVATIERKDVPDSEFAPPAGYKKTSLAGTAAGWTASAKDDP